mmetsp:Transcript_1869/g.3333  ORF Transcript_1869/g.3333 Transcript_1869/m.3333 type:complete len:106 (-) Transcript_1869:947-1264(-)
MISFKRIIFLCFSRKRQAYLPIGSKAVIQPPTCLSYLFLPSAIKRMTKASLTLQLRYNLGSSCSYILSHIILSACCVNHDAIIDRIGHLRLLGNLQIHSINETGR